VLFELWEDRRTGLIQINQQGEVKTFA